jgi:hypothetical protein
MCGAEQKSCYQFISLLKFIFHRLVSYVLFSCINKRVQKQRGYCESRKSMARRDWIRCYNMLTRVLGYIG